MHSVLACTVAVVFGLYMATNFAPVITQMGEGIVEFPEGAAQISNLDTGGNILNWIILKGSELFNSVF